MVAGVNSGNIYSLSGLLQSNGVGGVSSLQNASSRKNSSLYTLGKQQQSYQVKLSAYGQLKSALTDFRTASDKFSSVSSVAPFKASSSDTAVTAATAGKDVTVSGTYAVSVSQLAKAQTLTSASFSDSSSSVGTGSLRIQLGSYNSNLNTFSATSEKTINIGASDGTLGGIANAINKAGAGLKASVTKATDGTYQLSLTSSNTGDSNAVRITAKDTSGNTLTSSSGLGQLAFDPTAATGSGRNLTETVAAQNAQLTVDGASVVSQSNEVTTGIKGVTLSLASVGSSSVSVAVNRDSAAFESSAKKFVDAYNTLQTAISRLTVDTPASDVPPLESDLLTNSVARDIRSSLSQASSGLGDSRLTLRDLGINSQADGKLSIDSTRLKAAFEANAEGAATVISNAARKLSATVVRDTGDASELTYTTRSLERSLQNIESRKSALENYTAQSYFGIPSQYSLFNYSGSSASTSAGLSRYAQVARL